MCPPIIRCVPRLYEQHSYDSYGNSADLTGNPFRYTGRRLDAETGLYYYRARYYSPAIGRFLQTDPIGYGDGLNWYAYVGNDPLNNTDPSGLSVSCAEFLAQFTRVSCWEADSGNSEEYLESKDRPKLADQSLGNIANPNIPSHTRRQKIFTRAENSLRGSGKLKSNERLKFINKFATAIMHGNSVTGVREFDTLADAESNVDNNNRFLLNGLTTTGRDLSKIYAGAALPRKQRFQVTSSIRKPSMRLTSAENMRFVIMHERGHGRGLMFEFQANAFGLCSIGRYRGSGC